MAISMRRWARATAASNPSVCRRPSTATFAAASACKRLTSTNDRRHLLDFDFDEIGQIFGFLRRRCDDRSNRFADKPHDVFRQHGLADRHIAKLVQHRPNGLHRVEIGAGEDPCARGRCNAHDPPGGDSAAHEPHEGCRRQIAGEAALTRHQSRVLEAPDRAAHPDRIAFVL
jgi:hypothetical protein